MDSVAWADVLDNNTNINENWEIFANKVKEFEQKHVPTRIIKFSRKKNSGMPVDEETRTMIKTKHRLAKKAVKSKDEQTQKEYRRITNKLRKKTRTIRKKIEGNLAKESKENPNVIWKYIKSKAKTREAVGELYLDPKNTNSGKATSDKEKAEVLSSFLARLYEVK